MPGGISIHVVDVSQGVPAAGMQVALYRLADNGRIPLATGIVGANGVLPVPDSVGATPQSAALYEAVFEVADFYRRRGDAIPAPAFIEQATYRFGIADPSQHYHLPLKVTPWGYSLFRGGA